MTDIRAYGVKCKTPDCGKPITLGKYVRPPSPKTEGISLLKVPPGKAFCDACGNTHEYLGADLRNLTADS